MFTKPNHQSGIPIYVQIKEQIIHVIEKGVIKPGEQLPSVRTMAEQLVINPNTVTKIYRELEEAGIIEVKHGSGAFVKTRHSGKSKAALVKQGTTVVQKTVQNLLNKGLSADEIRRIVQSELQNQGEIVINPKGV